MIKRVFKRFTIFSLVFLLGFIFNTSYSINSPIFFSHFPTEDFLLASGDFKIILDYSETDSDEIVFSLNKWDGTNWSGNSFDSYITDSSVTDYNAIYTIQGLPYGKYRYSVLIKDYDGDTSLLTKTFYVDDIEISASATEYQSTTGNDIPDEELEITIKTIGVPYSLNLVKESDFINSYGHTINDWDGDLGLWYFTDSNSGTYYSISNNPTFANETPTIDINGNRQTFLHKIKIGSVTNQNHVAGVYNMDIGIDSTLFYASPVLEGPFDGVCGDANGKTFQIVPNRMLCDIGSPTVVLKGTRWTWDCLGINSGGTASCSAEISIDCDAVNGFGEGNYYNVPALLHGESIDLKKDGITIGNFKKVKKQTFTCNNGVLTFIPEESDKMIYLGDNNVISVADTKYPGCDSEDIIIKTATGTLTISSCNAGATIAGTHEECNEDGLMANRNYTTNLACSPENVGYHYQWGNNYGFSQLFMPSVTEDKAIISSTDVASNYSNNIFRIVTGDFFLNSWATTSEPNATIILNNLWGHEENKSNFEARKGPCEDGYHVPSRDEWNVIQVNGQWLTGPEARDDLLLPLSGIRMFSDGRLFYQGTQGHYWAGTPYNTPTVPDSHANRNRLRIEDISATNNGNRAYGYPVRCVKNY